MRYCIHRHYNRRNATELRFCGIFCAERQKATNVDKCWWKPIRTKQQKAWPMTEQEADQEGGGWLKQS